MTKYALASRQMLQQHGDYFYMLFFTTCLGTFFDDSLIQMLQTVAGNNNNNNNTNNAVNVLNIPHPKKHDNAEQDIFKKHLQQEVIDHCIEAI